MPLALREIIWLFGLSGVAGLIYESLWTHYLKLLLGHAAHAQTLVLAIFMGGLALGAWLAARLSPRLVRVLLAYALAEAVLAALAFGFHPSWLVLTGWLADAALPATDSPALAKLIRWTCAGAMIAPQSILLGMTFPLLSAGLVRAWPQEPGRCIALLYFVNSLGASAGVLLSGFVLVPRYGLPGTLVIAGTLNALAAAGVATLAHGRERAPPEPARTAGDRPGRAGIGALLAIALLTGLASFIYELVWIRMLSMVLGAATHSFELMLSAFILGLALGGWWLQGRLDSLRRPVATLARVQILMGIFAIASLAAYGQCFEWMSTILSALARNDAGYRLFILASHAMTLLIMLPTTICAGMTLPLVTHIAMNRGAGEQAIGRVYAANTLGAIAGIAFTVHLGLPWLGLRTTLLTGAAIDIGLGVVLLLTGAAVMRAWPARGLVAAGICALALGALVLELDPRRMASGVYRYGRASVAADSEVLFHRDGRTATVNLVRLANGHISITTNGKPDASINMSSRPGVAVDEPTMVLAAALPLALHREARTAAVIGLGSGLTAATALASRQLARVDTIEIEPAMIEAAEGFRPRVARVWDDPRSHLHVDDARSFLATSAERYDIIISEPSNPWVSGVANLFSTEFYRRARRHLAADGLLVQWIQLYEIDLPLVASILKALGEHFAHYELYVADNADLLVVASGQATGAPGAHVFANGPLAEELHRVGVRHVEDLHALRIGNRELLGPVVESFEIGANSDFQPVLDYGSARARFLQRDARDLPALAFGPLPIADMLDPHAPRPGATLTPTTFNPVSENRRRARALWSELAGDADIPVPAGMSERLVRLRPVNTPCDELLATSFADALAASARDALRELGAGEARAVFDVLAEHACVQTRPAIAQWLSLYRAVTLREAGAMYEKSAALLARAGTTHSRSERGYLIGAGMLGAIASGDAQAALDLWQRYSPPLWPQGRVNFPLRTLLALAKARR